METPSTWSAFGFASYQCFKMNLTMSKFIGIPSVSAAPEIAKCQEFLMCCITYQSAQEAMIAMFLCSSNKLLKWNSTSSMTMMTQEYQEYFYYVMNNKCLQFPSTTSQGKLRKGKFLKENSLQLQTFRPDIFICWIADFTDQSNRVCVCVCVCVKRKSILSLI